MLFAAIVSLLLCKVYVGFVVSSCWVMELSAGFGEINLDTWQLEIDAVRVYT